MARATQLIATSVDDNTSSVTNIGFTFNFAGTNYTQFSATSNGLMGLGSSGVTSAYSNNITGSGTYPIIMPWWDDLYTGNNGNVRYLLSGTAPNRKLTVEWNETDCCSSIPYDKTFQVWLLEGSNIIEIVYGTCTNGSSASVGVAISNSNYYSVTTSNSTLSTTIPNNNNNIFPASGNAYIFSPPQSYSWSPATFLSSTTIANPVAAAMTSSQSYTVLVTSAFGCTTTATSTVTVKPSPSLNLGPDVTQCLGTVPLDAGNPGSAYVWSTAATTQTITVSSSGTY